MITLLTSLSALAALVFLAVVAYALIIIANALENIGGRGDSYLAKLRFGLRAIERETSHLPATAPALNETLSNASNGLQQVDGGLARLHSALVAQESR